jgi:hypothetical protein
LIFELFSIVFLLIRHTASEKTVHLWSCEKVAGADAVMTKKQCVLQQKALKKRPENTKSP